ncbi:hypothetical protein [Bradyrhizobium sacchari]|uniref:hypothetical protein n=1 Tax=Bradyrhizobium sacchari TaxID=1399419 RepID=UPI001FD97E60|nr:hypothetical protein [Bradyrhizobium sacchari]
MLLRHWLDDPHRPTRDLDLLGFGESDPQLTAGLFRGNWFYRSRRWRYLRYRNIWERLSSTTKKASRCA